METVGLRLRVGGYRKRQSSLSLLVGPKHVL